MKKAELIKAVSNETGIGQKDITTILDSILVLISEELKAGNEVVLKDFGALKTENRPERTGRNPKTGEKMLILEKQVVKFKPYKNILNMKWL
jgi:nucleoid DNA-binding protein